jgi:hypothetical protein
MRRACVLVFALAASAVAAPVPKLDPELERVAKAFGEITGRDGCALSLDARNRLAVKLEKARAPKPKNEYPQPTGVTLVRTVKGDFTATVRFRLKTNLTEHPEGLGMSVGLSAEYATGEEAGIGRSFAVSNGGLEAAPMFVVRTSLGSHTSDGTDTGLRGRGASGVLAEDRAYELRARRSGNQLLVEEQNGKDWAKFDELKVKAAGAGTVKLTVFSHHPAPTELLIEHFEVK